jgi:hypothetical protein
MTDDQASKLFKSLDADGSGKVSQAEWGERTELTSDDKAKLLEVVRGIQEAYRPLKHVASVLKERKYTSGFVKALIGAAKTAVAVSMAVYALPAIGAAVSGAVVAAVVGGVATGAANTLAQQCTAAPAKSLGLISRQLRKDQEVPSWMGAAVAQAVNTATGVGKSWFKGIVELYQGVKTIAMSRDAWRTHKLRYIKLTVNSMMLLREAISEAEVYVSTKYILSGGEKQSVNENLYPKGKGSNAVSVLGKTIGFTSYKSMAEIIRKAGLILQDAEIAIEDYLKDKEDLKTDLVNEITDNLAKYFGDSKKDRQLLDQLTAQYERGAEEEPESEDEGGGYVLDEPETSPASTDNSDDEGPTVLELTSGSQTNAEGNQVGFTITGTSPKTHQL